MIEGLDKLKSGVVIDFYNSDSSTTLYVQNDTSTYSLNIEGRFIRVQEIEREETILLDDEKEALLQKLRVRVAIRDEMGGVLYWNVLNEECCNIANQCASAGCDRQEIRELLGQGNFFK